MKGSFKKRSSQYGRLSQSILNGVVGDYLDEKQNPLAIKMGFYHHFHQLDMDASLIEQLSDLAISNKVVVLVHGLTNLETVWNFEKEAGDNSSGNSDLRNYGTLLQDEFAYTPLFVRYNTGLPIESNGQQLSELLDTLFQNYPMAIDELVLIGFSMGGLLLRHAQKNAIDHQKPWIKALNRCLYIGTPHEGSPLEKFGHITGEVVRNIPLDYVNHWAEWIDIRSQGIKDLKHGLKPLSDGQNSNQCDTFYSGSKHYFISGSVSSDKHDIQGKLFGDSLVRQGSAIPSSRPIDSKFAQFENLPHVPLAHSEKVYQQISKWFLEEPNKVKLKQLPVPATTQKIEKPKSSNQDLINGALELGVDTANKVIDTSETMHKSIAKVPFGVLKNIPLIEQVSKPVESAHNGITDFVFGTLKAGGKKAQDLATKKKT